MGIGLYLHKNLRMLDIRWLRPPRVVCCCRDWVTSIDARTVFLGNFVLSIKFSKSVVSFRY